jgi:hypothetical protein
MRPYSHPSEDERDQIGRFAGRGAVEGAIARALRRAKVTIPAAERTPLGRVFAASGRRYSGG